MRPAEPAGRPAGRPFMIDSMRFDHESAAQWYERAIVANSIAATQEEALATAGNPTAIRVARLRAEQAAVDLQ